MVSTKIPVGVLGATGVVGQRFIQLLEAHPWFEVAWLAASDRSEGKPYGEATRWRLKAPMPAQVRDLVISPASPNGAPKVIFAALDAAIARELEPQFAAAGCAVVSNSSAFRMDPSVPLVIPEVNPDHLALLEQQCWRKQSGGYIVTNPNCSAIGLVVALAPLDRQFGIDSIFVTTMQAISGAGYPGVASLDILGNVIPYIAKEEEKMEEETRKLLGKLNGGSVVDARFRMTAHCNRVAVEDGHTESVSIKLNQAAERDAVLAALTGFKSVPHELGCPSAPAQVIAYDSAADRPQPRFDIDRGNGMTVSVGRLRPCGVLDWKFTVLSHNTIRGAAGAALLNAELLKVQGYLS
jgi:aspartate-semialdehyde dehydrogenase